MEFRTGDIIRITQDVQRGSKTVPSGSTGIVRAVLALIHCYTIDFHAPHNDAAGVKVHESFVTAASPRSNLRMSPRKRRDKKK